MSGRRLTAMGSKQCVNRSTVMDGWTSAKRAAITDQLVNLSRIIYRHARGGNEKSTAPGIQRAAQTVLVVYLKRTYSRVTSASSALAVLNDYALYKSTHSLTHSLAPEKYKSPFRRKHLGEQTILHTHIAYRTTYHE